MNHYFDDIFTRHPNQKEKSNGKSPARHGMRRSSTSRSIGARSDFESEFNGEEYYDHEHEDVRSVGNSAIPLSPGREQERREYEQHEAHYVSEQLERVRSNTSANYENNGDEFEAQLDGQ